MSIKIYNGYKIPNMSALELKLFFDNLRNKLSVEAKEKFIRKISYDFSELIDMIYLGKVKEENYINWFRDNKLFHMQRTILSNLNERFIDKSNEIKETNRRNPDFDLSCQISIIPTEDFILCQIFEDTEEYIKIWESMPGVESFGYWNNADPPEGMSYEDWDIRYQIWNKALNDFMPPSECGFTFEFIYGPYATSNIVYDTTKNKEEYYNEILKNMPSYKKRLDRWAKEICMNEFMQKFMQEKGFDPQKIQRISETGYFEALDFIKTPDGISDVEKTKEAHIKPFIKADITKEDLYLKFEDIKLSV